MTSIKVKFLAPLVAAAADVRALAASTDSRAASDTAAHDEESEPLGMLITTSCESSLQHYNSNRVAK